MRTLLTTAACAALVAGLAGANAQQSGQDDTTRAVSPDEYFGTQTREAPSQAGEASQQDTNLPLYEEGADDADLTGDDSAEALNARQLRDMERQGSQSQDSQDTQRPSTADRLRQRRQASSGQAPDDQVSDGQMTDTQTSGAAGTVMVTVEGLDEGADVYVALQTEAGFASGGGEYTQVVRPDGGQAEATFEGVTAGDYAVAVFQDTDGDGTVTLGRTGPTEPWGFSGAPEFADAKFSVEAGSEARADVSVTSGSGAASMQGNARDRSAASAVPAVDGMDSMDDQDTQSDLRSDQPRDRDAMREAMRRRNLGQSSDEMDAMDADDQAMMSGEPATVTVTVTGAERRGQVYVALQSQADFAQSGGKYTQVVRVRRGEAEATFTDVEPGQYAVAAFQDTDRDGGLTLTATGPTEPWGFSGNVSGAPSFDAAAIDVSGDTSADVTLQAGSEEDASDAAMDMPTMDDAPRDADDQDMSMGGGSEDMADMAVNEGRMGDMDTSAPVTQRPRGEAAALVYRRSASLSDDALTAADYLDAELVGQDGDDVAEVKDVILDPSGTARGVVLASGGLFGLGENHYAVNFDRVSPELDGGAVVLRSALTEDDIERLRDFDYDGFKADKGGLLLASELRGARVMIGEGDERAEVEDVVMNRQGGVEAIVLGYDDDRLVAPFERVEIGEDGSMMIAGTSADMGAFPRYEGRPGQARRRGVLRRQ